MYFCGERSAGYYFLSDSETWAEKEIQDGSAGDGKKEDKVTDADVAVKDAGNTGTLGFEPSEEG